MLKSTKVPVLPQEISGKFRHKKFPGKFRAPGFVSQREEIVRDLSVKIIDRFEIDSLQSKVQVGAAGAVLTGITLRVYLSLRSIYCIV